MENAVDKRYNVRFWCLSFWIASFDMLDSCDLNHLFETIFSTSGKCHVGCVTLRLLEPLTIADGTANSQTKNLGFQGFDSSNAKTTHALHPCWISHHSQLLQDRHSWRQGSGTANQQTENLDFRGLNSGRFKSWIHKPSIWISGGLQRYCGCSFQHWHKLTYKQTENLQTHSDFLFQRWCINKHDFASSLG